MLREISSRDPDDASLSINSSPMRMRVSGERSSLARLVDAGGQIALALLMNPVLQRLQPLLQLTGDRVSGQGHCNRHQHQGPKKKSKGGRYQADGGGRGMCICTVWPSCMRTTNSGPLPKCPRGSAAKPQAQTTNRVSAATASTTDNQIRT